MSAELASGLRRHDVEELEPQYSLDPRSVAEQGRFGFRVRWTSSPEWSAKPHLWDDDFAGACPK